MNLIHRYMKKILLFPTPGRIRSNGMKALEYQGPDQIKWVDVAAPEIEAPTDVIIRPIAVATCDLDWTIVKGETLFSPPFILGHEFVGDIVEAGSEVRTIEPGQRVSVAFQPSCGHCGPCGTGASSVCRDVPPTSMFGVGPVSGDWGGAFADLIRVPFADNMLRPIPDGFPPEWFTSVTDNVADAYRAVGPYIQAGRPSRVLVVGNNDSIPLYAVAFAKQLGAEKVTFCTQSAVAAKNAERLGASVELVDQWPARVSNHDITVCVSVDASALMTAIRSTAAEGNCTSCGIFGADVEFPIREMYMRGIHFHTGRVNGAAVHEEAVEWITSGLFKPFDVDTKVVSWDEVTETLLNRPAAKIVAVRD